MEPQLFATVHVRDFAAATQWYERLLGREPSFRAHATEVVWMFGESAGLAVEEDGAAAGGASVTLFLGEEYDATVEEIAARGLDPDETETYSNGVRKAIFRDADGNEIGLGGGPAT